MLDRYDTLLTDLESYLMRQAKQHDPQAFHPLRRVPGVGKVLALTILYEIHDVHRFDRVRHFASYEQFVKKPDKRFGERKALSILSHELGRAATYMLLRGKAFEIGA